MDFELFAPRPGTAGAPAAFMDATSTCRGRFYGPRSKANTARRRRWTPLRGDRKKPRRARRPVEPVPAVQRRGAGWRRGACRTRDTRRWPRSWAACLVAAEVFNCSAPDTGNMEVLARYGSAPPEEALAGAAAGRRDPLAFAMTEPAVASATPPTSRRASSARATNTSSTAASGGRPAPAIRAARSSSSWARPTRQSRRATQQQSMILVPADTPASDRAPAQPCSATTTRRTAMEVLFENVRVPVSTSCSAKGRGFEIARGRLGPGRIHHCMRLIGVAERALELMCRRA